MLVEAVFADGSGPAKVYVRGEASEDLTQAKLDALCATGQIGEMLEAESVPVMEKLQRLIAQERDLAFILAGSEHEGGGTSSQAPQPQPQPTQEAQGGVSQGPSWVTTTFHAGACAMCLQHDKKLQRCTGCKHVYLCGAECLKKYWPRHKTLCKAISKAVQEDATLLADTQLHSHDAFVDFVSRKLALVATHLKRPLDAYETDVLWRAKVCEVCRRVNGDNLHQCSHCLSAWHCPSCADAFAAAHSKPTLERAEERSSSTSAAGPDSQPRATAPRYATTRCAALRNDLECSQVLLECGGNAFWMPPSAAAASPAAAAAADSSPAATAPTPSSAGDAAAPHPPPGESESDPGAAGRADWEGWLNARDCPGFVPGYLLPVTLELSYPLTLAHALSLLALPAAAGSSLTVHVIGAEPGPELTNAIKYEEVLHALPSLSALHIAFVGPALAALPPGAPFDAPALLNLCDACKAQRRECTLQTHPLLYQDWRASCGAGWRKPDAAVAFNARCWDLGSGHAPAPDTWGPAVDQLLSDGVPIVFSEPTPEDAEVDAELMEGFGARVALRPSENPWASLWWRPQREARSFEAENLALFAVKGRAQQ